MESQCTGCGACANICKKMRLALNLGMAISYFLLSMNKNVQIVENAERFVLV